MGKGGDSVGQNPVFYGSAECRLKGKVSGDKKKLTLQSSWHICPASAQGRFGWVGHLCKVCDLGNIGKVTQRAVCVLHWHIMCGNQLYGDLSILW